MRAYSTSAIHSVTIGPLTFRVHGRHHPDADNVYDYDWLLISSTFDGVDDILPLGSSSFEGAELYRFRNDLTQMAERKIASICFLPLEQLCQIEGYRSAAGHIEIEYRFHRNDEVVRGVVQDEDLVGWSAQIEAIFEDYIPRPLLDEDEFYRSVEARGAESVGQSNPDDDLALCPETEAIFTELHETAKPKTKNTNKNG